MAISVSNGPLVVQSGGVLQTSAVPPDNVGPITDMGISFQNVHMVPMNSTEIAMVAKNGSTVTAYKITVSGSTPSISSGFSVTTADGRPEIAMISADRAIVTWYVDGGGTPSNNQIRARVIDFSGATPVAGGTDYQVRQENLNNNETVGDSTNGYVYIGHNDASPTDWAYSILSESGGVITVEETGASRASPPNSQITDNRAIGTGRVIENGFSDNDDPNVFVRDFSTGSLSVVGSDIDPTTTGVSLNTNEFRKNSANAILSNDVAVVLTYEASAGNNNGVKLLRKITGLSGSSPGAVGSQYTPVASYTGIANICEIDSTRVLFCYQPSGTGNELEYQVVDCSGATPVNSGSSVQITATNAFMSNQNSILVQVTTGKNLLVYSDSIDGPQMVVLNP